jgi:hypothetical protein
MAANILCSAAVSAAASSYRAFRELTRLFARRLGETTLARVARFASLAIALVTCAGIIGTRVAEGPLAPLSKMALSATRASMWLVALAIALAASHQRSLADRKDGIELIATSRGFDGARLGGVRAAAAFSLSLRWMLVPAVGTTVAAMAGSGSLKVLLERAAILGAVTIFCVLAAAVLGALGAAADLLSARRGRTVLLSALVLSALVAEVARDPALSITGGLLTAFKGLLYLAGAGKLA